MIDVPADPTTRATEPVAPDAPAAGQAGATPEDVPDAGAAPDDTAAAARKQKRLDVQAEVQVRCAKVVKMQAQLDMMLMSAKLGERGET